MNWIVSKRVFLSLHSSFFLFSKPRYIYSQVSKFYCGSQNNAPPGDVHLAILRTCQYVICLEKMVFADVITLRILRWGKCFGLAGLAQYNHKGSYKRETGMSEPEKEFWRWYCCLWKCSKGPWANECRRPLVAG